MRSSPRPLWLLLEARVPIVVAAEAQHVGKTTLLAALLDFLPPDARSVELAGEDETFDWLPQASELGWPGVARPAAPRQRPVDPPRRRPSCSPTSCPTTCPPTRGAPPPASRSGPPRSATAWPRRSMPTRSTRSSRPLRRPPVRLADDELSHLGVVLVLRRLDDGRRRVVAAHYVRPVVRDDARPRPAARAGRPRDLGPDGGRIRALRLGHHPGARAPRRSPARATSRSRSTVDGPSSRRSSAAGTTDADAVRAAIRGVPPGRAV